MKKTYKTFNGENRNCLFKVGKELVTAAFTPTFSTDDISLQRAIEDSQSFNVGKLQLVTPPMQWIKIDRDENGFATEKCTKEALKQIPIIIRGYDELGEYHHLLTEDSLECDKMAIFKFKTYTHYLPIPKLEV
jgi:hypothetical protein